MAIKRYKITFSHLLRIDKRTGKPQFIISAIDVVAFTRFTASIQFFKHHSSKTDKILSIIEVK